jgi:hypothetical protein
MQVVELLQVKQGELQRLQLLELRKYSERHVEHIKLLVFWQDRQLAIRL